MSEFIYEGVSKQTQKKIYGNPIYLARYDEWELFIDLTNKNLDEQSRKEALEHSNGRVAITGKPRKTKECEDE